MNSVAELPNIFGKIISEARRNAGLSQEQVADAIGATNVYICLLETGKRQPSLTATILLARSLGIRPEELLRRVMLRLESPPREPTLSDGNASMGRGCLTIAAGTPLPEKRAGDKA
ncbi:helix-turn-helix transcriptional regulator [uncultured Desulfovibrio sp.]|uniref:helix-turn-helix domain-containing protein n=1 Tax=uncultured Desulfovibrio sp. TaxID=167968 RepID=UPI0028052936|nr:helix-turn-helix transcriptional regulator [uncultured Desulfovibrio sp.]